MDMFVAPWNTPGGTGFIFILLVLIAIGFIVRFVLPALALLKTLGLAVRQLENFVSSRAGGDPDAIATQVMNTPRLVPLWREYAQTLHGVSTLDSRGTPHVEWRATAMAESFFTESALVDIPLKTEFYKHLPGILTGIGILGTFAGLIAGLAHFQVNTDAETVRISLKTLIQGVGHAFQVSALAIALAMLVTWIEKSLVTRGYRQVARLGERLDSLFEGGVEEEYLARLVRASEISAHQGAQLHKALVGELHQSLDVILQKQLEQSSKQQEQMANAIASAVSSAVSRTLREPLGQMVANLERISLSQGEATVNSLNPVLEKFMARMESHLGQGQSGLESMLTRTVESLAKVISELGQVSSRLEHAGQGTLQAAAGRLDKMGEGVGQAAGTFAQAGDQLVAASASLTAAALEASTIMREQARTRDAFAKMLETLNTTFDHARREAVITGELVSGMERAAAALGHAEGEARHYLEGVSKVLAEAHGEFAENVEHTLRQGNAQFHRELATAVDYLKGAIEEMGDTLEVLVSRK